MKQRDIGIDVLKFMAVLAITNSHMDVLYGKYSYLATGGAIGDALFFFVSEFTLFLGGKTFDNYYKKRINRIYPTVFAWAMLKCILFADTKDFLSVMIFGGGWFVSCIMIYYVILFMIRRFFLKNLMYIFTASLLISMVVFPVFQDGEYFNMYAETYYKWVFFFVFMLQGAAMGWYSQQKSFQIKNIRTEMTKLLGCIVLFYNLCAFKKSSVWNCCQVLSLFPLLGVTHYFYGCCNNERIKSIYTSTRLGWCMNVIGGLCLEIYLVQSHLFTDKLNFLFPLNIILIFFIDIFCEQC